MIGTIIIVVALIVCVGWLASTREQMYIQGSTRNDKRFNIMWVVKPVLAFTLAFFIAIFQPFALTRVDASGVGFKVHLTGDDRGVSKYEYKTGWVVYNTWSDQFVEVETFQQHIDYDTIPVITKGGFTAEIRPSFNYSVVAVNAADMYVNLRKTLREIEQGWLRNAIFSSVNDIANKWTVDSIFNWREQFESAIIVECNKRVSKWFTVSQLRSNIMPPKSLTASIEAKTKAIQDVQVADNRQRVAVAEALTNLATAQGAANVQIAKARGDSAAAVISANGQAEAIRIQQKQLTPLYIDWVRATQWDGAFPSTMLGGNASTLFQLK
jgi:regulator of protease activity HflC (stomatin/prohibitin superfamily)